MTKESPPPERTAMLRIEKLKIERFRSLKSVEWEPGALNVVIGPNASGKSNLLKVLELLRAAARGELKQFIRDEGGMGQVLWDGSGSGFMVLARFRSGSAPDEDSRHLRYVLSAERLGASADYVLDIENLKRLPEDLLLSNNGSNAWLLGENGDKRPVHPAKGASGEPVLSIASSVVAHPDISNLAGAMESWAIYPLPNTGKDSKIRQATVARYETSLDPDGQNLVSVLHTLYERERSFRENLDLSLKAVFGDEYEALNFPPVARQNIELEIQWKSLSKGRPAADLSDGTLRFLYLFCILGNPNPPPLIAIDEPETGLHPSMLPVICETAVEASSRSQIIFTTHSPEFLNGFRDATPVTTVVESHEGETRLRVVSGESLDHWLKEYTLGELFRTGELEAST